MRIGIATGTRADWGLLQPLAASLAKEGVDLRIFATHQHLMPQMGDTLREIERDGFHPAELIPAEGNAAEIMSMAAAGFAEALTRHQPDALILLGDRCEMLGVASAALLLGIPLIHIAGGTISEGAFDDSVRHAITKMATIHFPETELCASRIIRMGEDPANVVVTGALGVANAMSAGKMDMAQLSESLGGWNPGGKFLVVTMHAATLQEGDPVMAQEMLLEALASLPDEWRFLITYPNSDVDPEPLIRSLHEFEGRMNGRVKVVPSLGRIRYLSAVALSKGVAGNSSSALVEVPSLGVPSLDIGIRQQGREHGPSVIHADLDPASIAAGLQSLISPEMQRLASECVNPYGRPDTVRLMTEKIVSTDFHPYPIKKFHQ